MRSAGTSKRCTPLIAAHGWAGPIGRQVQHRQPATQRLDPEPHLARRHPRVVHRARSHTATSSYCTGKSTNTGARPSTPAAVHLDQLPHQQPHRPTIGRHMVDDQHQHVLAAAQPDQHRPQLQVGPQIERLRRDGTQLRGKTSSSRSPNSATRTLTGPGGAAR